MDAGSLLEEYGPHKTLYNRFIRWSRLGVFDRIFAALADQGSKPERVMIDSTHLKARCAAAGLLKKGFSRKRMRKSIAALPARKWLAKGNAIGSASISSRLRDCKCQTLSENQRQHR